MGRNLWWRALTAFALMVGFYALALGIVGLVLWAAWLDISQNSSIRIKTLLAVVFVPGAILWAIAPRPDRFTPPGPEVDPEEHPDLLDLVHELAETTGQEPPAEVFLIPGVNAFVSERGGTLGFGRRRIMGVGLPLLQGLSVGELRGVLAHEFGHYHGGDTALGPIVYRTHQSIGRALHHLSDTGLQLPFRLYGKLFMRVTTATSRLQEYAADELAAEVVGPRRVTDALRKLPGLSIAWLTYLQTEWRHMVDGGVRPPLAAGFAIFLRHPKIVEAVENLQEMALGESVGSPYDSHPPLPDRIAAVEEFAAEEGLDEVEDEPGDDRPAITLLGDIDGAEAAIAELLVGERRARSLESVSWEAAGRVTLERFRRFVGAQAGTIEGVTLDRLPELARNPGPVAKRLSASARRKLGRDGSLNLARQILGTALACALSDVGWTLVSEPGEPVVMRRGDTCLRHDEIIGRLASGEITDDAWQTLVHEYGLQTVDIPAVVATAAKAARGEA